MAWVTAIGSNPAQIDYRLGQQHGCVAERVNDRQFGYHTDLRERALRWIGNGLAEVGIEAGRELAPDQFDQARALLNGHHPRTSEQLVRHKVGVPREAKVPVAQLLRLIDGLAAEHDTTVGEVLGSQPLTAIFERASREVSRRGELAVLRADHAGRLADAVHLAPVDVWGEGVFERAAAALWKTVQVVGDDGVAVDKVVPNRVMVGNFGYDVTLTVPKSYSLLLAFADEDIAAAVEKVYTEQADTVFGWLEHHTAYGMRGHHGDGATARTVAGSGFLGWAMVHRAARPVDGAAVGDPHWHVHYTIANLTRGTDGKWSTVAAGGRDLMRHIPAADKILQAVVRKVLVDRYGITFDRSERTGLWELAAIPDQAIMEFSKRGGDVEALLLDLGFAPADASNAVKVMAQQATRAGKTEHTTAPDTTLREYWQAEARHHGLDPDALAYNSLHPRAGEPPATSPSIDELTGLLQNVETGLTAHMRRFSRVDAIAAVADALPTGATPTEIEQLTDQVLNASGFVHLADGINILQGPNGKRTQLGAAHMANSTLYTTADIVTAEKTIATKAVDARPGQTSIRVDQETAELAASSVEATQGFPLSAEQRRELIRFTTSGTGLDALIGGPGSGKTTLMRAVRVAFESHGFVVAGAATQGVATQNLHAETGIESRTVAQWLWHIRSGAGLAGVDVLILDEATLTHDRDRAELYEAADRSGTIIREIGDPKQLRGVGPGSMFAVLHQLLDGGQLVGNRRQVDEDERAALAAWRRGDYSEALSSWADRYRLITTETTPEITAAMLATWLDQRDGAPDPFTQMRGLIMVAATNHQVDRLNTAAQAVRGRLGELGSERTYQLVGSHRLYLRVNDHVMVTITDRRERRHQGPDLHNGYRGIVDHIHPDGSVDIRWEQPDIDGADIHHATLSPGYIANGGVRLGYALTIHKSQGLTIGGNSATWHGTDGQQRGGTVLFHAAGADNPGSYVAASRDTHNVWWFAAREEVETTQDTYLHGIPRNTFDRTRRVATKLIDRARATETNANDRPALIDLDQMPTRPSPNTAPASATSLTVAMPSTADEQPRLFTSVDPAEPPRPGNDQKRASDATRWLLHAWSGHSAADDVARSDAFGAVAHHLDTLNRAGHDASALLQTIDPADIAGPRIRDPGAALAWHLGQLRRTISQPPSEPFGDNGICELPPTAPNDQPEKPDMRLLVARYERVLTELIHQVPRRVSTTTHSTTGLPPWLPGTPAHDTGTDAELAAQAQRLAAQICQRTAALAQNALAHRPPWTDALGPEPDTAAGRLRHIAAVSAVAAYREQYRITGTDPLGAAPINPDQRRAYNSAKATLDTSPRHATTMSRSHPPAANLRQQPHPQSDNESHRHAECLTTQQHHHTLDDGPIRRDPTHGRRPGY